MYKKTPDKFQINISFEIFYFLKMKKYILTTGKYSDLRMWRFIWLGNAGILSVHFSVLLQPNRDGSWEFSVCRIACIFKYMH